MPELPEAETIVRTLAPRVVGGVIRETRFPGARVQPIPLPDLVGRRVRGLKRYGKKVVFVLDGGWLAVELRMTGLLLWRDSETPYTRAVLRFAHGQVAFDDIRQFGSMRWLDAPPCGLGPDPLAISEEKLGELLRGRDRLLKPLLLDQHFLRGLGNIYVDEILFRARIHPLEKASRLGRTRVGRLHGAMRETLREAIQSGGSSISDYVDALGRKGSFQLRHRVYGREGMPCPVCGAAIRRLVVGQRGTHICLRCQRKPGR